MIKKLIPFVFLAFFSFLILLSDLSKSPLTINTTNSSNMNGHLVEFAGDSPQTIYSQGLSLNSGDYQGVLNYTTVDTGNILFIRNNGQEIASYELNPNQNQIDFQFSTPEHSLGIELSIFTSGTSYFYADKITLIPSQRVYNDSLYLVFVVWIVFAIFYSLYFLNKKNKLSTSSYHYCIFIFAMSLFTSLPLLSGSFALGGDDLLYHLSRIEGIKDGLLSGQFPVYIFPEALNGNGYLNTMYPNLFLYIPALLRVLGVSYVAAYKTILIIIPLKVLPSKNIPFISCFS